MESDNSSLILNKAPDYDKRYSEHRAMKARARLQTKAESWPVRGINYGDGLRLGDHQESRVVNDIELEGIEILFYDYMTKIMAAKRKDGDISPAIALDLGGMYGIPFMKVA